MSYAITYFGDGVYKFTNGGWKAIKVLIITTILNSNERKYKKKQRKREKKQIFRFMQFVRSMHPSTHREKKQIFRFIEHV